MEAGSSETLIPVYKTTSRHIPNKETVIPTSTAVFTIHVVWYQQTLTKVNLIFVHKCLKSMAILTFFDNPVSAAETICCVQ